MRTPGDEPSVPRRALASVPVALCTVLLAVAASAAADVEPGKGPQGGEMILLSFACGAFGLCLLASLRVLRWWRDRSPAGLLRTLGRLLVALPVALGAAVLLIVVFGREMDAPPGSSERMVALLCWAAPAVLLVTTELASVWRRHGGGAEAGSDEVLAGD